MKSINFLTVKSAINDFIEDLNKYPIFYELDELSKLNSDNFIDEILDIFDENYTTSKAEFVRIPYDIISSRILIIQPINDIIIKYILMNLLKSELSSFSPDETRNLRKYVLENNTIEGICFKVDIFNCYENINHDILFKSIQPLVKSKFDDSFFKILRKSLEVNAIFNNEEIFYKNKGLLIGSKPDEFLANILLETIDSELKTRGLNCYRQSDEFIVFSKSLNEARLHYEIIEKTLNSRGFQVNKAKNIIKYFEPKSSSEFKLELILENATDPILIHEVRETKRENKSENVEAKEIENPKNKDIYTFLEAMNNSKTDIRDYSSNVYNEKSNYFDIKYPSYINKTIFNLKNLERLLEIIKFHPKGQYYTSLAIELLVFVSKKTNYTIERFSIDINAQDNTVEVPDIGLNQSFVYANTQILELLRSGEIHDYQKYLILRHLFKDADTPNYKLSNYQPQIDFFDFFDAVEIKEGLSFQDKIIQLVTILHKESNYYLLKNTCKKLLQLKN